MSIRLGDLATRFDCELVGDPDVVIERVAALGNATPDSLSFLANSSFKRSLSATKAGAVIVRPDDADNAPTAVLLSDNPYATYARMAAELHPAPAQLPCPPPPPAGPRATPCRAT
jgi:UDP-3-O-[3-hydroxymyristoyl] glucosamine N-acyltransferase